MDSFKQGEIKRMEKGGNKKCQEFFHQAPEFEDAMTISERYGSSFGEDYKEKLTADVEGQEWVRTERPKPSSVNPAPIVPSKERNESFFSRLGSANASRPADLPPSQGGKYAGFGSTPAQDILVADGTAPSLEDFSKDPVGALSKGFGFFTTQVTRTAKTVNEAVIQPTAQKLAEAELAKHAAALGQKVTDTGKYGVESLTRFVDNAGGPKYTAIGAGPPEEHKDFWDNFGEDKDAPGVGMAAKKPTATGTMALKSGKKEDTWGDDNWESF